MGLFLFLDELNSNMLYSDGKRYMCDREATLLILYFPKSIKTCIKIGKESIKVLGIVAGETTCRFLGSFSLLDTNKRQGQLLVRGLLNLRFIKTYS